MSQDENEYWNQWNSNVPMPPLIATSPSKLTAADLTTTPAAPAEGNHNDANTPPPPLPEVDTFQSSLLFNRHLSSQDPDDGEGNGLKRTSRRKRKPRKKVRLEHPVTGEVFYDFVETEQEKQERIQREKDNARIFLRRNARIQYDLRGEQDIAGAVHYLVCSNSINRTSKFKKQEYSNVELNQDLIHSMEDMSSSSSESTSWNDSLDHEDFHDDNDNDNDNDDNDVEEENNDNRQTYDNTNQNDQNKNDIHERNTDFHAQASNQIAQEWKKKDPTSAPLLPYQLDGLMAPIDNEFDYSKLLKKHHLDVGPWNDKSYREDTCRLFDTLQRIRGNNGYCNEAKPQPHLQITQQPNLEALSTFIISSSKIGKLSDHTYDYHCQSLIFKPSIAKYFMKELSNGHTLFSESMQRSLGQYLDALTCTLSSADTTQIALRCSYEFASNWELWNEISPRVLHQASIGLINRQEYSLLRHELLSGNGQNTTGYDNDEVFSYLHRRFVSCRRLLMTYLEIKEKGANTIHEQGRHETSQRDLDYDCVPKHENRFSQLHDKVIHESSIDVDSMNLILTVMHGIICGRLVNIDNCSETDQKSIVTLVQKTRLDIEQFLDHLIKTGCRDESVDTSPVKKSLSSAPLSHAMIHRQSIIANTRTEFLEEKWSKRDNHSGSTANDQDIAKKLAFHGQTYLKDTRVRIFHRIHISTAIATLAQHLPHYAVKILKQPIFDGSFKELTPFDIIRKTLSRMEQKEDISHGFQNSYSISTSEIHINELIRYFQQSADIFGSLLNHEEEDLFECRCWYAATLVGLLCLASGVHMSNTVSPALPPAEDNMLRLSQSDQQRFRHKEYCTIRLQCVRAVGSLLMSGERERGTRAGTKFHLAIKSLLEWQQASCLLAMRPYLSSSNAFYKLKCLHASHCYDLARKEVSMKYYPGILDLCSKKLISKRELLSLLVLSIDKEPYEADHWYRLAGFLYATKDYRIHDLCHYHWGDRYASLWSKEGLFEFPSSILYSKPKERNKEHEIKLLKKEAAAYEAINKVISSFKNSSLASYKNNFFVRVSDEIIRDVRDLEWMWPRDEPCFDDAEDYLDLVDEDSGKYQSFEKDVPSISSTYKNFDMMGPLRNVNAPTRLILSKIMVACYFHRGHIEMNQTMIGISLAIRSMVQLCIKEDCEVDIKRCEFMSLCILEELNWNGVKVTRLLKEWQNDVERDIIKIQRKSTNDSHLSAFFESDEEDSVDDDDDGNYLSRV